MITSLGYGTYMFFGSLMILMGIWAYFFVPETKGKTLEQMEDLFNTGARHARWRSSRTDNALSEKEVGIVHVEEEKIDHKRDNL
jgi:hypothetical protein